MWGKLVRTNDLVAELDPQPLRDALRTSKAKLAQAQAVLEEAAHNQERQRTLRSQGWSTEVQFDSAVRAFETAKAEVEAAAAQVHDAEEKLGYTQLLADAPGTVIATGAESGEVVRAGQTIVTVAHQDGADAVFDVPAALMRQVSPDALITVALNDDPSIRTTGRVREVAPEADPVTRRFWVEVWLTGSAEAMRLGATVTGQAEHVWKWRAFRLRRPRSPQRIPTSRVLGGRSQEPASVVAPHRTGMARLFQASRWRLAAFEAGDLWW